MGIEAYVDTIITKVLDGVFFRVKSTAYFSFGERNLQQPIVCNCNATQKNEIQMVVQKLNFGLKTLSPNGLENGFQESFETAFLFAVLLMILQNLFGFCPLLRKISLSVISKTGNKKWLETEVSNH